jgi:hypothetical protein
VILETIEHLQGILVDVLSGDVVLRPGQDAGHDQASVPPASGGGMVKGAASRPGL